ncbi:MAG: hypothetical protein LBH43_02365 [Treponema sp.]|jgi:hypothetical protein|nr:hypothetical protein [Treponema sp.]
MKIIKGLFILAAAALLFAGCASGGGSGGKAAARGVENKYLDSIGIPLGAPVRSGTLFFFGAEGSVADDQPVGKKGVTSQDFVQAKYFVLKVSKAPDAIVLVWMSEPYWDWNGQQAQLTTWTDGVEWKEENNELWVELEKALPLYEKYLENFPATRFIIPDWGAGGVDLISAWLVK